MKKIKIASKTDLREWNKLRKRGYSIRQLANIINVSYRDSRMISNGSYIDKKAQDCIRWLKREKKLPNYAKTVKRISDRKDKILDEILKIETEKSIVGYFKRKRRSRILRAKLNELSKITKRIYN